MSPKELDKAAPPRPPQISMGVLSTYSGPLPPAEQLEHYEKLHNGAAKLFFDKFAEEQTHRCEIEKNESDANIRAMDKYYETKSEEERLNEARTMEVKYNLIGSLTGQILSVSICLAGLALCGFLAMNGREWVAVSVVAIPFAGIIRAMIGVKK